MLDTDTVMGTIERYGWALQYALDDDPERSFAYTVGLHRRGLPEIVVAGLPPEQSWPVLNDVAGRSTGDTNPIRRGAVLTDVVAGFTVRVEPLEDTRALTVLHALAPGAEVRAVELVPVGCR
jgi:hypothetical protein